LIDWFKKIKAIGGWPMAKQGVVAFAFGVPATILSNRRIAEMASKKARELGALVYTQRDVQVGSGISVYYIEERPGNPPPTLRIARGAVKWAQERELKELWIACAMPHLRRCERDLRYAIIEAGAKVKMRFCLEIIRYPEGSWYCPDSTQKRVRSQKDWMGKERILMLMPMFFYKLVAS